MLIAMPFTHRAGWVETLYRPMLVVSFAASIVGLALLRRLQNLTPGRLLLMKAPFLPLIVLMTLYLGPFSPASGALLFSVYVYALGGSRELAFGAYLLAASTVGIEMLLVTIGVMRDPGMIRGDAMTAFERVNVTIIVQGLFALVYAFGRASRASTLATVEALENAVRQASQREVLLREANEDLERLHGGRGRASGERVGQWQLGLVLGRGGMGEVYEATHVETGQRAAVKVLTLEAHADPNALARFRREADALSRLENRHVVAVLDIGVPGSGPPFIAMELLRGEDLSTLLRREPQLLPGAVIALVADVATALGVAHGANIVHRDLKPQNVFFSTADGCWKVLDFGISKLGSSGTTLTMGHAVGTPGYMAPEQARGADVDHRADVFSLAVIAYRAITGHPAFKGNDVERLYAVLQRQPLRPGELTPLPRDVDLILGLALAKRREDRPETAAVFSSALALAYEGRLGDALRARAERLVGKSPWGKLAEAPAREDDTRVEGAR